MDKRKLFDLLTDLLLRLDETCEKYHLRYWVIAGSLLGAIRHKGLIPWDDDVDVCMPREDYNKLITLANNEFSFPYFFQTAATDPGFNKTFARLRNSDSTEIPYKDAALEYNHGVFIDIFPLDSVPVNAKDFQAQIRTLKRYEGLLHFQGRINSRIGSFGLSGKKKIAYIFVCFLYKVGIITPTWLFQKYNEVASRFENEECNEIGMITFSHESPRFIFEKSLFDNSVRIPFESIMIYAPSGHDEILKKSYGDYMTPVRQSSEHGETLFEASIPYKQYVMAHKEELWNLWIKYRHIS